MARDRQRSKARKRARAAGQQPRGKRSRARDIGLDDPNIDESGLIEDAPAPDPLKNVSPDVDQARAAETGVARGPAGDEIDVDQPDAYEDDDFERGEDEVEIPPDLVGGGGGRRGGGLETVEGHEHPDRKDRGRVATFLRGCIDELRRVQWPDRKHVFQATTVVLVFCLITGFFLGAMDALFQPLINAII